MSKYTTELRYICEMAAGVTESKGYDDVEDIVTSAAPHIFNNFAIFDEQYRLTLEKKILMHYYTREICEETVGLWKLRLATRMNEIMPIFNKLYETELLKYNPFYDVDYTIQRENNGIQIGTNKGTKESDVNTANNVLSNKELDTENNITTGEQASGSTDTAFNEENSKSTVSTLDTKDRGSTIANGGTTSVTKEQNDTTLASTVETENDDTVHVLTDGTRNTDIVESSTTTDEQLHWDMFSNTPQGTIADVNATTNAYLTEARKNTADDTKQTTSRTDNDEVHEDETTTTDDFDGTVTTNETKGVEGKVEASSTSSDVVNTTKDGKAVNSINENAINNKGKIETTSTSTEKEISGTVSTKGQTSTVGNESTKDLTKTDFLNTLNTTDEFTERVFGKRGSVSYTKMLMELRDSFINIDEMIINKLSDLFFGLW